LTVIEVCTGVSVGAQHRMLPLSDTPGTGCVLTQLLFIIINNNITIIIIIDNYPVNCSFSATLNLNLIFN
jgi:hypothetical protein